MGHVNFFCFLATESHYLKINMAFLINYFNFHVPFKTSCELASSIKIKMQITKLLIVLILFRSFSWLLFIEKFSRRFVHFDDTVTYFDKIVMFSHRGSK